MFRNIERVFLLNTPEEKCISRDMAGGLGFDRSARNALPPLDLLTYATVLHAEGCQVELLDAQIEDLSATGILDQISGFEPDAVILTVSLPTLNSDILYARKIKKRLHAGSLVILKTGIRHLPVLKEILSGSECDFGITGECELEIKKLLEGGSHGGTARMDGAVFIDTPETLLHPLDKLPVPDRRLLKNDRYAYSRLGSNFTTMQSSRGCPFSCGYYCPYPLVQGKKWRPMSADRVLTEISDIVLNHGIEKILFRDATFTLDRDRTKAICQAIIAKGLSVRWWCETRVDCLDEEMLELMQQAGCKGINVGIETGDKALMADLAKTGLTPERIVELTDFCRLIGIELHYLLMVGLPGESRATLFETFKLVDRMEPESIGVTTVTPYPGTQLYDDAVRNGWIIREDIDSFDGHGYNMQIDDLHPDDLKFALDAIHAVSQLKGLPPEQSFFKTQSLYREFSAWKDESPVCVNVTDRDMEVACKK